MHLFAIALMHAYVFWRAASVPLIDRHGPQRLLIGSGVVLWTVFFLGRVFGHGGTGPLTAAIEFFGVNWVVYCSFFASILYRLTLSPVPAFSFSDMWLLCAVKNKKIRNIVDKVE